VTNGTLGFHTDEPYYLDCGRRPATRSSAAVATQVITSRSNTAPGNSFPAARPSPSPDPACGRLALSPVQPDCARVE